MTWVVPMERRKHIMTKTEVEQLVLRALALRSRNVHGITYLFAGIAVSLAGNLTISLVLAGLTPLTIVSVALFLGLTLLLLGILWPESESRGLEDLQESLSETFEIKDDLSPCPRCGLMTCPACGRHGVPVR